MFDYSTIKELLEQLEEVNKLRSIIEVTIEGKWVVILLSPFKGSQTWMTLKFLIPN